MDGLIGQRQHVEKRVEMADGRVDVDRLDRIAAPEMNKIERLPEPKEVPIVALVARPSPAGAIEGVGGARDGTEGDVTAADGQIARGVARVQGELLRREPDPGLDDGRIEANPLRGGIDIGPGVLQHGARAIVQEVDPDLLQDRERRLVDRFEFVLRNQFEGRERRRWLRRRR